MDLEHLRKISVDMTELKRSLRKPKSNVNMQLKSFDRNIDYVRLKRAG